ncbi:hypothetical protein [Roseateles sp.]|uniref:hypothetical protein n=1 Tax=Roseateles sp. TaxID=1971397 RepID=UPI003BA5272E
MELNVEGLAAVSLFLANVVVIIVVIGTYWRMTRYEESNHIHIVNALRESREAGREMKIASRELLRAAERGGAGGPGLGLAGDHQLSASDLRAIAELPQLVRQLLGAYGSDHESMPGAESGGADDGVEPMRWPERAQEMDQEQLESLKQSHRKEVERILAQRRRVQMELSHARERLEESSRLLNNFRARATQSLSDKADLNAARQRAERAERTAARLQRELEEAALNPQAMTGSPGKPAAADPAALKKLEKEAQAQREQLADAARTIEKLRRDLEVLSADPPQHDEPSPSDNESARHKLEKEIEKLNGRVEELEDSLRRNLVEKNFIEEHYLKESQKQREAEALLAMPAPVQPAEAPQSQEEKDPRDDASARPAP